MAITEITFSKLSYWKKPPLSVQLSVLWKESVLSHRALNREVLCGHTRLSWAVSWRETFEPSALWRTVGFCLRLICSRGWKRFNGGRPLHHVGLWSFSKGLFFKSRAESTTIEGSGREKGRYIQEIFYSEPGLARLTLEDRGRSPPLFLSGNLGINHGWFLLAQRHFKILPESWKKTFEAFHLWFEFLWRNYRSKPVI